MTKQEITERLENLEELRKGIELMVAVLPKMIEEHQKKAESDSCDWIIGLHTGWASSEEVMIEWLNDALKGVK